MKTKLDSSIPIRRLGIGFILVIVFFIFVLIIRGEYPKLRDQLAHCKIFTGLIQTQEDVHKRAQYITVDYFTPSFESLNQFVASRGKTSIGNLEQYENYYTKMIAAFPKMAEAYAMLGFVDYYLGKEEAAIGSFQKATELNPYLFPAYYNLGVIYFKNHNYAESLLFFKKAVTISPEITFKIVKSSKLYQDLIVNPKTHAVTVPDLNKSYLEGYKLLVADCYYLKNTKAMNTIAQHALDLKLGEANFFSRYMNLDLEKEPGPSPEVDNITVQIF